MKKPAPIVPRVDPNNFFKRQRREEPAEEAKLGASVNDASDNGMVDDNVPYDPEEDEEGHENEQLGQILALMPNQANSQRNQREGSIPQASRRSSLHPADARDGSFESASNGTGTHVVAMPQNSFARTPIESSNMAMV